jgi:membrane protein DedA with SNARE-associated domain
LLPEPFVSWFQTLLHLLSENDGKALFLLLLLEEAGIPLPAPGDMVIMLAGYRAAEGHMDILQTMLVVVVAVQAGSTILYLLSRRLGHAILFKFGRFIHLDQPNLDRIERWIQERGPIMVLVGRLTPGLRTPTSIMSGIFEVPFLQFLFYTTAAAVTWGVLWLSLGYYFGRSLLPLTRGLHSPLLYLGIGMALLAIGGLSYYRRRRQRKEFALRALPGTLPVQSHDQQA